jgi:hypothetical protein
MSIRSVLSLVFKLLRILILKRLGRYDNYPSLWYFLSPYFFFFPSADSLYSLFQVMLEWDVKNAKSIANDIIIPDPANQVCVTPIYLIWLMSHAIILVIPSVQNCKACFFCMVFDAQLWSLIYANYMDSENINGTVGFIFQIFFISYIFIQTSWTYYKYKS